MVSLARALVKDTNILILDEATGKFIFRYREQPVLTRTSASVDYETDRNIQDTIAHEFKDRTILCIAHRLRTIIGYDRICVMDAGQIAVCPLRLTLWFTQLSAGVRQPRRSVREIGWHLQEHVRALEYHPRGY